MWPFTKKRENDEQQEGFVSFADAELLKALLKQDDVSEQIAMNIPAFAACVSKITGAISTIPIRLYRRDKEGFPEEVQNDSRTYMINMDPGDTLTAAELKRAVIKDYLLHKGGYVYINRNGNTIRSLHYVDQQEISFLTNRDPIEKSYTILCGGRRFYGWQFLKVLRQTRRGYSGTSIINQNALPIATAYNELEFENNRLKTGGGKRGFLESEKKLTEQAMSALKSAYSKLFSNSAEVNGIVLNDGVKFHEVSESSAEMQLNENKKTNATEICKLFDMPPAIINGNATEQDRLNFVQFCLIPILKELCNALNRDLLLESEKDKMFFEADVRELTKADIKTRYEAYKTAISSRWMQLDDVRKEENLPSLNMPFNMFGLSDVFYNSETGVIYTPNTNKGGNLLEAMEGANQLGQGTDSSKGAKMQPQPDDELQPDPKAGKEEPDEGKNQK